MKKIIFLCLLVAGVAYGTKAFKKYIDVTVWQPVESGDPLGMPREHKAKPRRDEVMDEQAAREKALEDEHAARLEAYRREDAIRNSFNDLTGGKMGEFNPSFREEKKKEEALSDNRRLARWEKQKKSRFFGMPCPEVGTPVHRKWNRWHREHGYSRQWQITEGLILSGPHRMRVVGQTITAEKAAEKF